MSHLNILCYQVKPPVPWMGYNCWITDQRGPTESHKTLQAIVFSLQFDRKALFLKTQLTMSSDVEKFSWCSTKLYPYWLALMVLEGTLHTTRGERVAINITQLQNLWLVTVTCLQDILVQWWHKPYGNNKPLFDWIKG